MSFLPSFLLSLSLFTGFSWNGATPGNTLLLGGSLAMRPVPSVLASVAVYSEPTALKNAAALVEWHPGGEHYLTAGAGYLNLGGVFSSLKNPVPATPKALGSVSFSPLEMTARLPASSSGKKDCAAVLSWENPVGTLTVLAVAPRRTETGTAQGTAQDSAEDTLQTGSSGASATHLFANAVSAPLQHHFSKKTGLEAQFSATLGLSPPAARKETAWYLTRPITPRIASGTTSEHELVTGRGTAQVGFKHGSFAVKAEETAALAYRRGAGLPCYSKSVLSMNWGILSAGGTFFISDIDFPTISGGFVRNTEKTTALLAVEFPLGTNGLTCKLGTTANATLTTTTDFPPQSYWKTGCGAGFLLSGENFRVKEVASVNKTGPLSQDLEVRTTGTFAAGGIRGSLNTKSPVYYEEAKELWNGTASLTVEFPENAAISGSLGVSCTMENKALTKESATVTVQKGWFTMRAGATYNLKKETFSGDMHCTATW